MRILPFTCARAPVVSALKSKSEPLRIGDEPHQTIINIGDSGSDQGFC